LADPASGSARDRARAARAGHRPRCRTFPRRHPVCLPGRARTHMDATTTKHDRRSLGRPARYALVLVGLYLTYLVLRPFLAALTWAIMFAILFHRMQAALVRKMTPNRAAAVTTTVVTLMIVIPAAFLITTLARQAPQAIERMSDSSQHPSPQMQR